MPELVKKLIVPPKKRTAADCKLMASALHVFISSIPGFKDGLLISPASLQQHVLLRISNFRMKHAQDFLKRMP